MLMVAVQVVLKWLKSTPFQSPKYESIAFNLEGVITFQSSPTLPILFLITKLVLVAFPGSGEIRFPDVSPTERFAP